MATPTFKLDWSEAIGVNRTGLHTMSLIDSLLSAIVRLDGDALVLHVGEKPYVVTARTAMNEFRGPLVWGQVELSSKLLTLEAVATMVDQFLPVEERRALDEIGAIEYELPRPEKDARFVVIAARGGPDIWLEIRRVKQSASAPSEPALSGVEGPAPPAVEEHALSAVEEPATPAVEEPAAPAVEEPGPSAVEGPALSGVEEFDPNEVDEPALSQVAAPPVNAVEENAVEQFAPGEVEPDEPSYELVSPTAADLSEDIVIEDVHHAPSARVLESEGQLTFSHVAAVEAPHLSPGEPLLEAPPPSESVARVEPPLASDRIARPETAEGSGAVVVPIARVPRDVPPPPQVVAPSDLDRLLRIAAARGASELYAVAGAKPVVRVDGEMQALDGEETLTPHVVEAFMMSVAQEPTREAVRAGETTEWICDMAEVGRVRCLSFFDHRGPGVIFRMLPPRAISAEQLGLSKEVQSLSAVPDGLVLLTGPRGSGTSTLVAAFIDLINRTRSEHVVTIESQIRFLHEPKRSFVSQREVRGQGDEVAAAVRAALREDPDVLVIEELGSPDAVAAAVEAAQSGRLVFAGLHAPAAGPAIERLIEQTPAERRTQLRSALASTLRGVVAQAMLRKRGGGRVAARELLLNTPAVAALITEGKLFQIPAALQSGRKLGMVPLNDALAALVRDGIVDSSEAYRHAVERDALLAQLRRDGLDTSFVERLA